MHGDARKATTISKTIGNMDTERRTLATWATWPSCWREGELQLQLKLRRETVLLTHDQTEDRLQTLVRLTEMQASVQWGSTIHYATQ